MTASHASIPAPTRRSTTLGQLSDWPRKSVEPIAVEAGVALRTLQECLGLWKGDEDRRHDRLHGRVAAAHSGPQTIGIIDETNSVMKGEKTSGVKRQWCGGGPRL